MSLTYQAPMGNLAIWVFAGIAGLGIHFAIPAQFYANADVPRPQETQDQGITGAVMFDLSDIIAAPSAQAEDSVAQAQSVEAPTVTQSPEVVQAAKAEDAPVLAQIPHEVEDDSLKFAIASPEPEAKTENEATEFATEYDPEKVDAETQMGAEDQDASQAAVSGVAAEQTADVAKAKSEGLTSEEKVDIQDWQKQVVLKISKAKKYPKTARTKRIEGEVQVRFTLDRYGKVLRAEVGKSSGWPVLDNAAVQTVKDIGKMPTPPNFMSGSEFTLMIPLRYRFR